MTTEAQQILLAHPHPDSIGTQARRQPDGTVIQEPYTNTWNYWPDMPLRKTAPRWRAGYEDNRYCHPALTPEYVFDLGVQWASGHRLNCKVESLPVDVAVCLPEQRRRPHTLVDVSFTVAPLGGQGGGGTRNLIATFRPWHDEPPFSVELGCDHQMRQTNLGRCYNRYDCTVPGCTYTYTVDSGD